MQSNSPTFSEGKKKTTKTKMKTKTKTEEKEKEKEEKKKQKKGTRIHGGMASENAGPQHDTCGV